MSKGPTLRRERNPERRTPLCHHPTTIVSGSEAYNGNCPCHLLCRVTGAVSPEMTAQERESEVKASDLPDGWDLAGYDRGADWLDVENGAPYPTTLDLTYADQVVLSYTDSDGETSYYTVHGGFDEDYTIEDAIDDLEDRYGLG